MKTPLKAYSDLSNALDIELKVKHDDFYPFTGGGSKARKMKEIIKDVSRTNSNALVSAGAANSNHARVTAITGAQFGWPVKLIIHDREDYSKGNLQLMQMAGAELIFVAKEDVSAKMDSSMADFEEKGYKPYYIWGGGHNVHGMKAYYDGVEEFYSQNEGWEPDYVILASGTGGTQAGLHLGFALRNKNVKVMGISVAREQDRGQKVVRKGIGDLCSFLNKDEPSSPVIFRDEWIGDGYGALYPSLSETIKEASLYGLITDPTYTGKALTALFDLCKSGEIEKKAKVLFWHTGGMINLFEYYNSIV